MTKADLIKKIATAANINATEAKQALAAGEKVQLLGFGTFSVNERPAREGKNPQTGEAIHIDAKKVAKFKAGADFEKLLNA